MIDDKSLQQIPWAADLLRSIKVLYLEAGANNAILYTLIENCKAAGLNPRDYFEYVLENLTTQQGEDLTPAKVAKLWNKSAALA